MNERWTGADCGRAIRAGSARLRAERQETVGEAGANAALWTLACLLTGQGSVGDGDVRQLERWLDEAALRRARAAVARYGPATDSADGGKYV